MVSQHGLVDAMVQIISLVRFSFIPAKTTINKRLSLTRDRDQLTYLPNAHNRTESNSRTSSTQCHSSNEHRHDKLVAQAVSIEYSPSPLDAGLERKSSRRSGWSRQFRIHVVGRYAASEWLSGPAITLCRRYEGSVPGRERNRGAGSGSLAHSKSHDGTA